MQAQQLHLQSNSVWTRAVTESHSSFCIFEQCFHPSQCLAFVAVLTRELQLHIVVCHLGLIVMSQRLRAAAKCGGWDVE